MKMNKNSVWLNNRVSFLLFLMVVVLSGCAATVKQDDGKNPVFPAPPDEPRFHFDRTLRSSADVQKEGEESGLQRLITGEQRSGVGMGKPFGVAVHQGRVFVSDSVKRVVNVYDYPEAKYFQIGTKQPGALTMPLGMDVDASGNLYVVDATEKKVQVYDRDGVHKIALGKSGIMVRPSGIAVEQDGSRIYVVDTGGVDNEQHQVLVFDGVSGEHLYSIGKRGDADGELNLPRDVAINKKDNLLYVVDGGNFRVQVFEKTGKFVRSFGSVGRRTGQFSRPKAIRTDNEGMLYIADTAFGNFQIFTPEGELLMSVGNRSSKGNNADFMLPAGIAVDEDGRVYMVDQYFKKVDIFRPHAVAAEQGFLSSVKEKPVGEVEKVEGQKGEVDTVEKVGVDNPEVEKNVEVEKVEEVKE